MSGEASFRIRAIEAPDLNRLAEIAAGLEQAPQWPRSAYASLLDTTGRERIVLVAEDAESGAVAGFVVARLIPPEAELESIAVEGKSQRRGVARKLFSSLAEELGRSGVAEIILEVRAGNEPAQGLYRSLGFVEEGRRRGYYADPVEDAVLMRLRLKTVGSGGVL
jgi:ribosomal-protein-alanine N-acetyltransferase